VTPAEEGAMGFVKFGGFVVSTKKGNYVKRQQVDEETLLKIAKALGIPENQQAMLASGFTSVFIYRGTDPPEKKPLEKKPPKKKKSP
jgi:hypothetical protein